MKKIWEERLKNKPTNLEQNIKIGKQQEHLESQYKAITKDIDSIKIPK